MGQHIGLRAALLTSGGAPVLLSDQKPCGAPGIEPQSPPRCAPRALRAARSAMPVRANRNGPSTPRNPPRS